jgi:hypothetical protein
MPLPVLVLLAGRWVVSRLVTRLLARQIQRAARRKFGRRRVRSPRTRCRRGRRRCPYCGRAAHNTVYQRNLKQRRRALLRDARDPQSGLSDRARQYIIRTRGARVPTGYEVSHEIPLYTRPPSQRCLLDRAWNMRTQRRSEHRQRHKRCGDQFHQFPPRRR